MSDYPYKHGSSRYWSWLCAVDIAELAKWLEGPKPWPKVTPPSPERIYQLPMKLVQPIIDKVLATFDFPVLAKTDRICLSRMRAEQSYPMHVDSEVAGFVTRVHVPITTCPGLCWFMWEPEPVKVVFGVGNAYSFDTQTRHAFGNDGKTDRVHLMFDVWRK